MIQLSSVQLLVITSFFLLFITFIVVFLKTKRFNEVKNISTAYFKESLICITFLVLVSLVFLILFEQLHFCYCTNEPLIIKQVIFKPDLTNILDKISYLKGLNNKYIVLNPLWPDAYYGHVFTHHPKDISAIKLADFDLQCLKQKQFLNTSPHIFHPVLSDLKFVNTNKLFPCFHLFQDQVAAVINNKNNLNNPKDIAIILKEHLAPFKFNETNEIYEFLKNYKSYDKETI
jgi:hypothetical protein